jgi:hypothetical protein
VSPLDEVAAGLWRFTVARNGIPPTMTAYALRDGEDTILVDPLVAGETEPLLAALDEIVRGRVRILVTTPFHVRGSELLWRRWRDRHEVTSSGTSTAPRGSTTGPPSGRCAVARKENCAGGGRKGCGKRPG